jgi:DMSO reductase family type II enzyme chaperone
MTVDEQITAEPEIAEARMAVYRLLLAVLDKPNAEQFDWLRSAEFHDTLTRICEAFSIAPPDEELTPEDFAEFESRYLACFEVGMPTPPVPLQASHYDRRHPAPAVIHEHILFYKQFGQQPTTSNGEPADHLSNELAFLIHLDERAIRQPDKRDSIVKARRDFLKRQAGKWPARAAELAAENGLPALYVAALALLAAALEQDRELTDQQVVELELEKRP